MFAAMVFNETVSTDKGNILRPFVIGDRTNCFIGGIQNYRLDPVCSILRNHYCTSFLLRSKLYYLIEFFVENKKLSG